MGEFDNTEIDNVLTQSFKGLLKGGEELNGAIAKLRREKDKKFLCPRQHILKRFTTDNPGYTCDKCKKEQPSGSELYGCRLCNWDCCTSCIQFLKPKKQVKVKLHSEVVYSIYSTWD